jgi:hypothetical protein
MTPSPSSSSAEIRPVVGWPSWGATVYSTASTKAVGCRRRLGVTPRNRAHDLPFTEISFDRSLRTRIKDSGEGSKSGRNRSLRGWELELAAVGRRRRPTTRCWTNRGRAGEGVHGGRIRRRNKGRRKKRCKGPSPLLHACTAVLASQSRRRVAA